MKKVYLDYHSTSPIDDRVLKAMMPFFNDTFGNPASIHIMGEEAKDAIEIARTQVADIIGAKSDNVFFTNSATEANNIVLNVFDSILTTNSEHSSVIESIKHLKKTKDLKSSIIRIEKDGTIDLLKLRKKLCLDRPKLLSIIFANNEIGTIHKIYDIGELCAKYGTLLHTDATQAIGKTTIDVDSMNIFALTMSGHKIYGPKGVGALYVRCPDLLEPIIYGGFQNTFSSGTQNVPAIVGMGAACELMMQNKQENDRIAILRDYLWNILSSELDDVFINGTMENRLPNNLNITIVGVQAKILAMGMDDVIISGGSACQSGLAKPSHVIKALKSSHPDCAIRISLGRFTTEEEIHYAAKRIIETVNAIRSK
jgi:cysteine desulfurase